MARRWKRTQLRVSTGKEYDHVPLSKWATQVVLDIFILFYFILREQGNKGGRVEGWEDWEAGMKGCIV